MSGLSVNEFRKLLKSEIERQSKEKGLKGGSEGWAFQFWIKELIQKLDRGIEEVGEAPMTGDGGVDALLCDETRKFSYLVSCKYQGDKKPILRDHVNSFVSMHEQLMSPSWLGALKNKSAREYLRNYKDMFDDKYQFKYLFVSTGEVNEDIRQLINAKNQEFLKRSLPITAEVWDFGVLKDEYDRAEKLERQTPEQVEINFQQDKWIELKINKPTILGAIKGNELRNLYKQRKDSLFAYNIRSFLGSRGINQEITKTAEQKPENFFFFNNGVTAICTDYHIDDNKVIVQGFQIINGAQTVGALAKAKAQDDIFIQFRLIKSSNVKTDSGINRDIIQYNNTQNPVKISDFRSNDAIQSWLENKFKEHNWKGRSLSYSAKRGGMLRGAYSFEELCKILYAFNEEPTVVSAAPKRLWTRIEDDGGLYEIVFGDGRDDLNIWSSGRFLRLTFALAAYEILNEKIVAEIKGDEQLRFLKRCRYHALALLGEVIRKQSIQDTVSDKDAAVLISENWEGIKRVLIDQYLNYVAEKDMTLFSFVRNQTEVWNGIKRRFALY